MPAIQTNDVVTRVSQLLQDTTHIRWPLDEKLQYITDACREVCFYKPDAYNKTDVMMLVAGTKQGIPSDGTMLLDVVRNMGVGGATPGIAPRVVSRDILDAQTPSWHTATPTVEVKHYTFDPQSQKTFYVYPPNTGTGSLEVVYAAEPEAAATGNSLGLDAIWLPLVVNYVMYRCYSKDAEYAANASLAAAYYQAFNAQISARTAIEQASDINRNSAGTNPNVRGVA